MSDRNESPTDDSEEFIEVDGTRPPLIAPGRYAGACYTDHEWWPTRYGKRLVRWFLVPTKDEPWGVTLPRFYRVDPKRGRGGKAPGLSSAFVREYLQFFPDTERLDRIPAGAYRDLKVIAEVETTTQDGMGRRLPREACYSVIRWLYPMEG